MEIQLAMMFFCSLGVHRRTTFCAAQFTDCTVNCACGFLRHCGRGRTSQFQCFGFDCPFSVATHIYQALDRIVVSKPFELRSLWRVISLKLDFNMSASAVLASLRNTLLCVFRAGDASKCFGEIYVLVLYLHIRRRLADFYRTSFCTKTVSYLLEFGHSFFMSLAEDTIRADKAVAVKAIHIIEQL